MNNPLPEPQDDAALMAQFDDLLVEYHNFAFDCGAFKFSYAPEAEYGRLCAKKSETEAQLHKLFRSVLDRA